MPELPEVETVRRGLEGAILGRRIVLADIRRPDLRWPLPERMAERLTDQRITGLRRRSKYLLADLQGGETLLWHLGMSGRVRIIRPEAPADALGAFVHTLPNLEKHDHVVLGLDDGGHVVFNDARRFGAMDLLDTGRQDDHWLLSRLGPEPLGADFTASALVRALEGRRTPIKAALLDQRVVAGLGNIYVCEALYRAGISPMRRADRIARTRVARLVPIIRDVLHEAIAAGGSTLRDHRGTDGALGYFQHRFAVYGREGAPCLTPDCAGTVRRTTQAGRSSFWCPRCQR